MCLGKHPQYLGPQTTLELIRNTTLLALVFSFLVTATTSGMQKWMEDICLFLLSLFDFPINKTNYIYIYMKYRIKRIKVKHHIICGCDPENSTHYHFAGLAPWKNNRLGLHLQGQHGYGHQFKFKTFQLPANVPDKAQEMPQVLGPCTHMGMLDQI